MNPPNIQPVRFKHRVIALAAWLLIRALTSTLRFRIHDRSGIMDPGSATPPVVWLFWHNRILFVTEVRQRFLRWRNGYVLTSPSDDGAILEAAVNLYGLKAVRGSSSRRGSGAIRELAGVLRRGHDVAITPDGPRGPRYRLHAGVVKLAQLADCPVLPIRVEPTSCWRLRSWDGFIVPKPFSRVEVVLDALYRLEPGMEVEEAKSRLEEHLMAGMHLR